MKGLIIFQLVLFFLCQMVSNAQSTFVTHYDIDSCKYKVDKILNNCTIGISFLDCTGNSKNVYYNNVDTLPKKLVDNNDWNLTLKNEISKITQKNIYIFLIYGVIVDKFGQISNIEKLIKTTYDPLIEERIIQLIKKSLWKPAIKDRKPVDYYFSFPVKINLT